MTSIGPGGFLRFAVSSRQECYFLESSDSTGFAVLHSRTATALQTLQNLQSVRFEAALPGDNLSRPDQQHKKGKQTAFDICINIYGSEDVSQEVGRRLSKARTYLQHPIYMNSNIPYKNPHFYAITGVQKVETPRISSSSETEDQQIPLVDIAKVFEEVEHTRKLSSFNMDRCIKTPLLEYGPLLK